MLSNTSLERMRADLMPLASQLIGTHGHMTWMGGDHSITLPLLRAYKEFYGKPLAVLHFDAHCDTWEDHFGEPSGHGTWVSEAFTEGLVVKECFFQVGIRSSGVKAAREYVTDHGGLIFTARELRGLESPAQLDEVFAKIRTRMYHHGNPHIYLSLDIDCLDPAFAPGTGTPEVGGLSTNQVLSFLETLVPGLPFVGMDLVEVAPPYDHGEITSQAGAVFLWTYLCAVMQKK